MEAREEHTARPFALVEGGGDSDESDDWSEGEWMREDIGVFPPPLYSSAVLNSNVSPSTRPTTTSAGESRANGGSENGGCENGTVRAPSTTRTSTPITDICPETHFEMLCSARFGESLRKASRSVFASASRLRRARRNLSEGLRYPASVERVRLAEEQHNAAKQEMSDIMSALIHKIQDVKDSHEVVLRGMGGDYAHLAHLHYSQVLALMARIRQHGQVSDEHEGDWARAEARMSKLCDLSKRRVDLLAMTAFFAGVDTATLFDTAESLCVAELPNEDQLEEYAGKVFYCDDRIREIIKDVRRFASGRDVLLSECAHFRILSRARENLRQQKERIRVTARAMSEQPRDPAVAPRCRVTFERPLLTLPIRQLPLEAAVLVWISERGGLVGAARRLANCLIFIGSDNHSEAQLAGAFADLVHNGFASVSDDGESVRLCGNVHVAKNADTGIVEWRMA